MRILIAEDERITRRSLARQLEAWEHEVVSAEDGAQALAHFERGDFEIVISDWDMPDSVANWPISKNIGMIDSE